MLCAFRITVESERHRTSCDGRKSQCGLSLYLLQTRVSVPTCSTGSNLPYRLNKWIKKLIIWFIQTTQEPRPRPEERAESCTRPEVAEAACGGEPHRRARRWLHGKRSDPGQEVFGETPETLRQCHRCVCRPFWRGPYARWGPLVCDRPFLFIYFFIFLIFSKCLFKRCSRPM